MEVRKEMGEDVCVPGAESVPDMGVSTGSEASSSTSRATMRALRRAAKEEFMAERV